MNLAVVWIDLEQAKLFQFSDDRMQREVIHASHVDHHTHRIDNDERDSIPMYEDFASRLVKDKKILILGPGTARTHFWNHLKEKHKKVAECVVGCEPSDHPTDHKIAAKALEFFGLRPGGQGNRRL
jgi:stalled ribosome rescue protein Dom34